MVSSPRRFDQGGPYPILKPGRGRLSWHAAFRKGAAQDRFRGRRARTTEETAEKTGPKGRQRQRWVKSVPKVGDIEETLEKIGASEGIRTLDTHVGNVMLYQAELRSLL